MPARRRLMLLVVPAALLAGPLADSASASVQIPAFANVTAPAPAAVAGGPGTLTFAAVAQERTPITKVKVALPVDTPLQDVTVPAMDGWTSAATTAPLPSCGAEAVNHVTWTATGDGIAPQGTGSFALQVGRFPNAADQVVYQGVVTYADGSVVRWTEPELSSTPATTVAVRAASTAPRPVDAAPATRGTWMSRFVNLVMSVW